MAQNVALRKYFPNFGTPIQALNLPALQKRNRNKLRVETNSNNLLETRQVRSGGWRAPLAVYVLPTHEDADRRVIRGATGHCGFCEFMRCS